jgi:hypothetical protein
MAISSQAPQECGEGSTTSAWSPDRAVKHHENAAIRLCSRCTTNQVFGTSTWCNPCQATRDRERRATDPEYRERQNAKSRASYRRNRLKRLESKSEYGKRLEIAERDKARRRERYAADPQFKANTKARRDRYYAGHAHVFRARDAKRRAMQTHQTPAWADLKEIRRIYALAERITKSTGVKHEVDHIVPLGGKKVSGLHVSYNLRVIPLKENRSKFNRLIEDIV